MAVEIKAGKLAFKQKPMAFERMSDTMSEIVKFRQLLEDRIQNGNPPLTHIPDEHKPLVAKLVHESDKSLQALARYVHHSLLPALDDDDGKDASATLPVPVVEATITSVATRVNYGLTGKVPAAWQVWRWEVPQDNWAWLPKSSREKVESRYKERLQAKEEIKKLFDALPESERNQILGIKPSNPIVVDLDSETNDSSNLAEGTNKKQKRAQAHTDGNESTADAETSKEKDKEKHKPGRPKKPVDPEKAAKEKEKEAKRQAKADKEKREQEAKQKGKNLMATFFGLPKGQPKGKEEEEEESSLGEQVEAETSQAVAKEVQKDSTEVKPKPTLSDFERTFRDFVIRKDAELAPGNWFLDRRTLRSRPPLERTCGSEKVESIDGKDVIVIDDEERVEVKHEDDENGDEDGMVVDEARVVEVHQDEDKNLGQLTSQERLHQVLTRLPPSLSPALPASTWKFKAIAQAAELGGGDMSTVRGVMTKLSEAEVMGSPGRVRRLLKVLTERPVLPSQWPSLPSSSSSNHSPFLPTPRSHLIPPTHPPFPLKLLSHHTSLRPPYLGTFTSLSVHVAPRTPFKRDIEQRGDYGWDSGEEWEEEEDAGEGVEEDVESEGEEDEEEEMDGWLIDDEDGEVGGGIGAGGVLDEPPELAFAVQGKKRTHEGGDLGGLGGGKGKKRRVVVPLVPYVKGPCWEREMGEVEDGLEKFKIQLLNDTPFPIDPFTWVSTPLDTKSSHAQNTTTATTTDSQGFLVPALPAHLPTSSSSTQPAAAMTTATTSPNPTPKIPFPPTHLPLLLSKITSLETGNLQAIVESVYQELKACGEVKVRKKAIEVRVREVGMKKGGKWIVREGV